MAVEVGKVPENPVYNIADIRFEHEAGGYVTIWFDIDGPSFEEPEVMKNIFVGFDDFLDNLKAQQLAFFNTLNEKQVEQHWQWLEHLDASGFDWKRYLRGYIDQCVDLRAAEKVRLGWMNDRRARQEAPEQTPEQAEWLELTGSMDTDHQPTWDDVAHAVIDRLNDTAIDLYPELLDCTPEDNQRLREILESHGERLANQLYALARSVREANGEN